MTRLNTRTRNAGRASMFLLALGVAAGAMAEGEAALYDASAPAGSAFVRVINAGPETLEVTTPEKTAAQTVPGFRVGEYLYLPGGKAHVLSVGGLQVTHDFAKDSATTLVVSGGNTTTLDDEYFTGRKKALISFYNLTTRPLALKTEDGKHAVVDTLESLANGSREINEIKIGLAAWDDTGKLAAFPATFLKKGRSYSYVVFEENGAFKPVVVADAISTIE